MLIWNFKVYISLDRKMKLKYLGLYVVVHRTQRSSYIIIELDGSVACFRVKIVRLLPY